MKIFTIVGLALAASSLANGLALKGSNAPRLSVQSQETLTAGLPDLQQEEPQQPQPYQFSYDAQSEGGLSTRTESGDATGRVIGQYSIKGADGISRIVSYTADSEGFRANITTNEPGTESQNPSFIVLQSSQLPAAEISRQLQSEADLAQEEAPLEEAELPQQPAKSLTAAVPRKSSPTKSTAARRQTQLPQQQQQPLPRQTAAQVSVPTKGRRPTQLAQQSLPASAPAKRPSLAPIPLKGQAAIRNRGPSKTLSTTPRPRQLAAQQPAKRPAPLPQLQASAEQTEEQEPQLAEQGEDAVDEESSEGF